MDGTQRNVPVHRLYRYVGPPEILRRANGSASGTRVLSVADLDGWITATHQRPDTAGLIPATFVIDADGYLCIADRHCERVVCAGGGYVRSAGEIFFSPGPTGWAVEQISNQSTGYCPEPESWLDVAVALDRIPLAHPDQFTFACVFRRCPRCSQLNIVKDDIFECAVYDRTCCALVTYTATSQQEGGHLPLAPYEAEDRSCGHIRRSRGVEYAEVYWSAAPPLGDIPTAVRPVLHG